MATISASNIIWNSPVVSGMGLDQPGGSVQGKGLDHDTAVNAMLNEASKNFPDSNYIILATINTVGNQAFVSGIAVKMKKL